MAIKPVKGSGISTVGGNPVSSYEDAGFADRMDRMFNPNFRAARDLNLRPYTNQELLKRAYSREGGILEALSPLGDALLGKTSNLGIPELRPMTGDRDTIGGELLQGLGNLGLAGLEGLRRTGETIGEIPFAIGRGLGTESESAYNKRMNVLANTLANQSKMQQAQLSSPSITSSGSIVGGPSYQQTPTDPDQDAAIRSQIADAQRITEEDGIFGDITQPGMGIPDFVGGVPAAQAEEAARTAAIEAGKDPEDQMFLGKADAPPPASKQETTSGGKAVKGADNSVKQSTVAALDDVLRQVKPDAKPKDYDDYMKEFAELTGLDVSGQPDNSQALMAFGLALMQNKAGKGFNVGEMLSSVGAAGEKAMPALAAARKEAKTTRIKAAEFAISRKDKDEAQMLNRQQYFVMPKDGKGFASNIDKAESTYINPLELNAMVTDKAFTDKFELIPGSQFNAIRKEAMKGTELGDKYRDKPQMTPLLSGAKDLLQVPVFYESPNYKGPKTGVSYVPQDAAKRSLGELNRMNSNLNRAEDQIVELVTTINNEGVTVFDQTKDGLIAFGRSIGVDFGEPGKLTSSQKVSLIFDRIQAQYAPQILQEAGKTISDADRQRVAQIVGGLQFVTTKEELTDKIRRIHEDIIGLGRANVQQAYNNLQDLTDYDIAGLTPRSQSRANSTMTTSEREELLALRKKQGIK